MNALKYIKKCVSVTTFNIHSVSPSVCICLSHLHDITLISWGYDIITIGVVRGGGECYSCLGQQRQSDRKMGIKIYILSEKY